MKSARGPGIAALQAGARVPGFPYRTLDGEERRLEYAESAGPRLLFVISTTCPFCQKSLPFIQEIYEHGGQAGSGVLVVSIHDLELTRRFAADRQVRFPLVAAASQESFGRDYGVAGVPMTILVGGDGVVEKVWEGEINASVAREIDASLARRSPPRSPAPS